MHSFNVKETVLFQTIQFTVSTQFQCKKKSFQTIRFCISTQFSSIRPIDRTLSGATTPDQSEPWINGKKWVLCIPQRSIITGNSTSNCLVSLSGYSLGVVLLLCWETVGVFYSFSRLGRIFVLRFLKSVFKQLYDIYSYQFVYSRIVWNILIKY